MKKHVGKCFPKLSSGKPDKGLCSIFLENVLDNVFIFYKGKSKSVCVCVLCTQKHTYAFEYVAFFLLATKSHEKLNNLCSMPSCAFLQ